MEFTLDYFKQETVNFRKAFGNKNIMSNEDKKDAMVKAYTLVYFNTICETQEAEDFLVSTFQNTIWEFNRRETMMMGF